MRLSVLLLIVLVAGCGGSQPPDSAETEDSVDPEVSLTAEDFASMSNLTRSELTTEVDAKRYRSAAPPSTTFSATEPVIYMVGKLKSVPALATIEVRWFLDAVSEPILVSDIEGSKNFQFIADFRPVEGKFDRGTYTARVYVNDREVGAAPFEIYDLEMDQHGPKITKIACSKKVNQKNKPVGKKTQFKKGTKKVFVSFNTKRMDRGTLAEVHWLRGNGTFHSQDLTVGGNRRYAAHIEADEGLPQGNYRVEILVDNRPMAYESFVIGEPSSGPSIEKVALGLSLDDTNMPEDPRDTFDCNCGAIACGLRFMDLAPDSVIELQWYQLDGDDENLRYQNRTNLPGGGEGTMGAAWDPEYPLEAGSYKLVVLVNGEPLAEQLFEVK